ncbi:hypothetical protein Ade02nite_12260 [Paractinoplanes deccanensis]|uniref:Dihydrofolate reductase n=1 Tax=Paractinoplanes deccanensis TaxID=113561 RepID=A0ABQ3XY46_9ACTN|nr:dihydrofolate reductase family protein [Actinoplanes deccanensis]GID72585.1 hypothetical protein Ade02nite_12260 [Actinoplanes deccanensis]
MAYITCDLAISADGYAAGVNQTREKPFGDGPTDVLHQWMFETPEENAEEIAAITAADAFIMGRNMFGPGRGAWDLGAVPGRRPDRRAAAAHRPGGPRRG